MSSIDRIIAKSAHIKKSRQCFYEKLVGLEKTLIEALSDIDVYAKSKSTTLVTLSPDDAVYGYLYFNQGKLEIAYRTTEDDFSDSMDNISQEERVYHTRGLTGCPIEWLEKLSGERVIKSFIAALESSLESIEEDSRDSINVLERALDSQSNTVSDSLVQVLKEMKNDNLHRDWLNARRQIQIDPADSISRTSSFLESICRMILVKLPGTLPNNMNISSLIGATIKDLGLSENEEADKDLRQLIGGVRGIFKAVGSLRTHFGTAHGSSPGDYEVDEYHARLASDTSAAVANFLLQRYKQKLNKTN